MPQSPSADLASPRDASFAAASSRSLDSLRGPTRPAGAAAFRLVGLDCPAGHPDARRLALLGIRPGVELRVLQAPGPRGAVVAVGTARIALGRDLVRQLQVVAL